MQLAKESRHLEVQLLGDEYGQAISLFGRDCSVQRRHQKIIEEAPAAIAPKDTFLDMERCAVRLAKLVGYVGTGTVEYLFREDENGRFLCWVVVSALRNCRRVRVCRCVCCRGLGAHVDACGCRCVC